MRRFCTEDSAAPNALLGGGTVTLLKRAGRTDEASAIFRQAMAATPNNSAGAAYRMYLYSAMQNTDSTQYWLNKAIDARSGLLFATSMLCNPYMRFMLDDRDSSRRSSRTKVERSQR